MFRQPSDLTGLLRQYRPAARLAGLERLTGSHPDRQWMLDLAEYQVGRVLQALQQPGAEPVPLV